MGWRVYWDEENQEINIWNMCEGDEMANSRAKTFLEVSADS